MEPSVTALAVVRAGLDTAPAPELTQEQIRSVWPWLESQGLGPLCAPVLLQRLAAIGEAGGDVAGLSRRLHRAYRENLARGLYLTAAAEAASDRLQQAGIAALTFKGPALAAEAYGGLGRRGFDDIDVLIEAAALPAAVEALDAGGWAPRVSLDGWRRDAYIRDFASLELTRDGDGAQLDLHWRLTETWFPVGMPVAGMLARRRPLAPAPGEPAPPALVTLAPEDHFAVVAVHAAKHLWRELRLLADVAASARRLPPAAWPAVLDAARDGGYARILRLNLALANELLGLELPPAAAAALAAPDPAADRLRPRLRALCLAAPVYRERPSWRLIRRLRERPGDGWRGIRNLIFCLTPRDWELAPLPRPLALLYYPLRLGRLVSRMFPRRDQPA